MHHTTTKGDIGVAMVTADLLCQGYEVMMPVSAVSPFDVVAYRCGKFSRLQVKSREVVNGRISFQLRRAIISSGKIAQVPLSRDDVDGIAVYCPTTKSYYYLPMEGSQTVTLRISEPANGQRTGIKFADEYKVFNLI